MSLQILGREFDMHLMYYYNYKLFEHCKTMPVWLYETKFDVKSVTRHQLSIVGGRAGSDIEENYRRGARIQSGFNPRTQNFDIDPLI